MTLRHENVSRITTTTASSSSSSMPSSVATKRSSLSRRICRGVRQILRRDKGSVVVVIPSKTVVCGSRRVRPLSSVVIIVAITKPFAGVKIRIISCGVVVVVVVVGMVRLRLRTGVVVVVVVITVFVNVETVTGQRVMNLRLR